MNFGIAPVPAVAKPVVGQGFGNLRKYSAGPGDI